MGRKPFAALSGPDRAFARMLASTLLRGLGKIDFVLDQRLKSPPPDEVRMLLRLGAAQILFGLAPAFAAVSTTLALLERAPRTIRFKGLANAVLRGIDREGGQKLAEALDSALNAPAWLLSRWRGAYGDAATDAISRLILETPPTDITPLDPAKAEEIATALEGVVLTTGSIRTSRKGEVSEWPGYGEGLWWVQDAAAARPALLLDIRSGETVLDMCAAPGGKTMQLAAAGAAVTALDRSDRRLDRLRENLARLNLSAELIAADAAAYEATRIFDAVLLDAPCSATGTFRRHPDVLWGARPADIARLSVVQAALLDNAARLTRPGGRLVYCVCSLEPEEGEAEATGFLKRHPEFHRHGEAMRLLPATGDAPDGGQDGFFAVRFDREP